MRRASDTLANITVFVFFFSPLLVVANYERKTGLAEMDVLLFFFLSPGSKAELFPHSVSATAAVAAAC